MNTPKKLDFGTAVNFQLEAKTTVYGKQKQEDALLIALIFKGFIQQDWHYNILLATLLAMRTFTVLPAI